MEEVFDMCQGPWEADSETDYHATNLLGLLLKAAPTGK